MLESLGFDIGAQGHALSVNVPWADCVDADAFRAKLTSHGASHLFDSGLASVVGHPVLALHCKQLTCHTRLVHRDTYRVCDSSTHTRK